MKEHERQNVDLKLGHKCSDTRMTSIRGPHGPNIQRGPPRPNPTETRDVPLAYMLGKDGRMRREDGGAEILWRHEMTGPRMYYRDGGAEG